MSQVFKRLIPTFNRILVRKFEVPNKTSSGIILTKEEDRNQVAEVVEVGPGNYFSISNIIGSFDNNGKRIPLEVKVGDTVLLPEFSGTEIKLDNQKYYVFRDSDVIGKLEK